MCEIKSEFEFVLNKAISYMKDGETLQTKTLILKSPCRNNGRIISKLRQGFFRGMKSLEKEGVHDNSIKESTEKKELSATEIVVMMDMSDTSMPDYEDSFEKLLLNDICYLDEAGKEKLTKPVAVKIDCEDFLRLLGEYLENFTMSSWRKMMTTIK